jgi:hypothetical protein
MRIDVSKLSLAVCSPAVVGSALKIVQAGGSELTDDKMRRVVGSAYLFKQHQEEILHLVREMEQATAQP